MLDINPVGSFLPAVLPTFGSSNSAAFSLYYFTESTTSYYDNQIVQTCVVLPSVIEDIRLTEAGSFSGCVQVCSTDQKCHKIFIVCSVSMFPHWRSAWTANSNKKTIRKGERKIKHFYDSVSLHFLLFSSSLEWLAIFFMEESHYCLPNIGWPVVMLYAQNCSAESC